MDDVERAYKELFGEPQFMMFVDESYEDFRQQIINLPYCNFESNFLPFEGISLRPTKESSVNPSLPNNKSSDISNNTFCLLLDLFKEHERVKKGIAIASLISSLYPIQLQQKHVFYLNSPNCCRAYGYYNEMTQEFIILKGSLVSRNVGTTYAIAPRGALRNQFIKKYCKGLKDYYVVHTDTVCKSATMAASFVLGRVGSIKRWIDKNGKSLSEVYSFK